MVATLSPPAEHDLTNLEHRGGSALTAEPTVPELFQGQVPERVEFVP